MPSKLEMLAELAKKGKKFSITPKNSVIRNLENIVNTSEGAYGKQRVIRAADEISGLERMYSPDALRRAFTGPNTQALVTMPPKKFEQYSAPIGPKRLADQSLERFVEDLPPMTRQQYIDYLAKISGGMEDVPYLELSRKHENALPYISGHEGRHRSRAFVQNEEPSSLVRIEPRTSVSEDLPRRSREEFIEALRDSIGNRPVVRPETYISEGGDRIEREIELLPPIYKKGGAVSQDAMRLAVMNQKVQKKAIGGASYNKLSKMGQWAFERLYPNRTYDSLNSAEKSDVTRYTNALSSPAVRRRESFSGPTLREQTTNVGQPRIITPADMYGKPLMPLTGDVSDAGFDLTQIAGIPLSRKVPVQGGAKYTQIHSQRGDPLGWASMKTAAEKKQAQAKKIAEQTGVAPYSVFTAMGPESINFSTPVIEAMIGQLHATKPSKAAIAEFNQAMKSKWGEYKANPEFIGIDSSDVINQFRGTDGFNQEGAGDLRKKAVELMSLAKFRNMGFPRYSDVAEAIIDPRLANAERGESGLAIFRSDPNASLIIDPNDVDHFSYNTGIPMDVSEGSMQLKHSVPAPIFYKDIFETGRREGFPKSAAEIKKGNIQRPMVDTDIQGALMMRNDLYQPTNQEWLDTNMDYLRKMYPNEYKDGGAVHMKDGNLVDELINEAKKKQQAPVNPFRMPTEKQSQYEKDIRQNMANQQEARERVITELPERLVKGAIPGAAGAIAGYAAQVPGFVGDVASIFDESQSIPTTERIQQYYFPEDKTSPEFQAGMTGGNAAALAEGVIALPAMARGAAKGVKAGSKALANEAAFRIHQAMTTGQGPLAGALAGVAPRQLITYHGTPHRMAPTKKNPLGEFDSTKIGTGEGAQAYGHGHYLAESPTVAQGYKQNLTANTAKLDGKPLASLSMIERDAADYASLYGGKQTALEVLDRKLQQGSKFDDLDYLKSIRDKLANSNYEKNEGALYKVDLPDEQIAKMLDWDKPLSEQADVIKALKGTDYEVGVSQKEAEKIADMRLTHEAEEWAEMSGGDPIDYSNNVDWENYVDQIRKESGSIDSSITGKDLHRMVMRDEGYRPDLFDSENYQVGTSQALRDMGIPGIKYLDANSRDAGKGTRNFVVFPGNEHMMNIVGREKDGGVVRMAGGGKMEALRAIGRGYKGMREPVKPKSITKEGGGNWLAGSVEGAMKPLKRGVNDQVTAVRNPATGAFEYLPATPDPMNQWIDKQLTRYVKNQMATKEDPIRALAEKGTLHVNPDQLNFNPFTYGKYLSAGQKVVAQSPTAKSWEGVTDLQTTPMTAGQLTGNTDEWGKAGENIVENNPWLNKVPDETSVYSITDARGLSSDLGFDHLIDELRNATNPASGLPRELLIKPESLSKLSVPQAVERVAKINEWRAAQKAEADVVRANNAATVLHKDYPDKGYSWKELKLAEAEMPEGAIWEEYGGNHRLFGPNGESLSIGATKDEAMRLLNREERKAQLEDALKYEGETMGHCVGGYCPDVMEGRSRIYSLRDAKGQPHVTVEVNPPKTYSEDDVLDQFPGGVTDALKQGDIGAKKFIASKLEELNANDRPSRIVQIKGKSNRKPNEEYLPFVQDFVKSGKWSGVGDFSNTGLMRIAPESNEALYLQKQNKPIPEYVSDQEYEEIRRGMADAMRSPYGAADEMKEGGVAHLGAGGFLKKLLPMAEREANKAKFLEASKVQERLYHGTSVAEDEGRSQALKRLKPSKEGALGSGVYLTPSAEQANMYTRRGIPAGGGYMLPVHAQLKNPLILDWPSNRDPMIEALTKLGVDESKAASMVNKAYEEKGYIGKQVQSRAQAQGYDGLMQYRDGELGEVVAYNPNAVKSAIGNEGTYDIYSPELNKAKGGSVSIDAMRLAVMNKQLRKHHG